MFGYIRIDKNELKIKDYNLFKSYYCGVCRVLKKDYGFPAHYFLSYDSAFLTVLLSSVCDQAPDFGTTRCISNPAVCRPVAQKNDMLSYAAAVNVLLVWFKLKDDWADNHSMKVLLLMPLMFRKKNKAKKLFPFLYQKIDSQLSALSELEQQQCTCPDSVAAVFGNLMAQIFESGWNGDENTGRILSHIGFLLGRLIYLMDAWADREDDKNKKAYNPFLLSDNMNEDDLRISFDYSLGELGSSLELLDIKRNRDILENIIYLGMRQAVDSVFSNEHNQKGTKKEKHHERPL